ncbi:MAG: hypothetical protein EON52_23005 [Actinomycetales bacterium]|nr:MAG: hypothetical protein EON52_23005 [Actinomycetales bacterium]
MQIGGSLFLLAAGAILAFAVRDTIDAVDLTMVGYILIAVGAIGLVVSLVVNGQRRGRGEVPPPRY